MQRIDPEGRLTRAERLVTVGAVAAAVLFHVFVLVGWGQLYRWAKEEQRKERMMVIRRVRDTAPPRDLVPDRPGRSAPAGPEGRAGERRPPPPPPADATVKEQGPEPPREEELSPEMEREVREDKPEATKAEGHADNAVSVVTDLPNASFSVSGPAEYRGSGTFWIRKGAPPGTYTATFHPVAGFTTPPIQSKQLVESGQIVFVGKYKRSTEIVVEANQAGAQFAVYRPDGPALDITRPGRALFDDLPSGPYTAVFKDLAGFITPAPQVKTLSSGGGKLSFYGEYRSGGSGSGRGGSGGGSGSGSGDSGAGTGAGGGGVRQAKVERRKAPAQDHGLDRRVQLVVKSYPASEIEEEHEPIPYPEMIIRRGNYQQGWCQVYLIVSTDGEGEIRKIEIERPSPGERPRFQPLVSSVENSVRRWNYARVEAEVHIDVRFYVE